MPALLPLKVAGHRVDIGADNTALYDALEYYFHLMAAAGEPAPPAELLLQWSGERVELFDGRRKLRSVAVENPRHRPAVTTFLLGMVLQSKHPELILLHGNAFTIGKKPVLLVGDSGAGKSTLTEKLLENGKGELRLAAEDLLLVHPGEMSLYPFLRAAALRGAGEHDPRLWWAFGGTEPRRLATPDSVCHERISLRRVILVFIGRFDDTGEWTSGTSPNSRAWILPPTAAAAEALRRHLPVRDMKPSEDYTRISFHRRLSSREITLLEEILKEAENLLLRFELISRRQRKPAPFPAYPNGGEMSLSEAVYTSLSYQRNYSFRQAEDPARQALRMARALNSAGGAFWIQPGGTPAETAEKLRELLDGEN